MRPVLFALLAVSAGAAPAAVTLSCPDIQTTQTLAAPPAGWQVSEDRRNVADDKLRGTLSGFSDGPPEQMAILAPDSETSLPGNDNAFVSTWPLLQSEQVWMICSYERTVFQLAKPLPAGLKRCSIEFGRGNAVVRAWCE